MKLVDSFIHKLARPVSIHNKTYAELTIRRPLVRDLVAAERQPGYIGSTAALLAVCGDMPFADFGHVDAADYRAILAAGTSHGFFPPEDAGGASGETSSS